MHGPSFVQDLAITLGVAAVTLVLFRRLKQPAVLGYLLAGLIVGPYIPIPLFADPGRVHLLSEFGVVLVMFAIGLEFRIARLIRVLPVSGVTGLLQMGTLFWLGFAAGMAFGWDTVGALFLGGGIAISSTMVVSSVFSEREVSDDVRELTLGVLVLQDVAAIALIATMTVVAAGGALSAGELASLLGRLGVVLFALIAGGLFVVPRAIRALYRLDSTEAMVVGATGLCFAMAVLAERLGYSVALGAFIAGILVAESGRGTVVEHAIAPLKDVFSAVFFVSIGMTVDPRLALASLGPAAVVTMCVVFGQLLSVTIGGLLSGNGLRRSLGAALALGQIGEFAFIIAAIGVDAGVAPAELSPILVTVAVATAFTTPLAIRLAPRLVRAVDHALPTRLQTLLVVYESWFEKLRAAGAQQRDLSPRRRARRAVVLDALGLMLIAIAFRLRGGHVAAFVEQHLGLDTRSAVWVVTTTALLLPVPIVANLLKNTDLLARLAAQYLTNPNRQDPTLPTDASSAEALLLGAFRATVLLGLGVPAAAFLRPLLGGPYVAVAVLALLALVAVRAFRTAHRLDRQVRSAAEALLEAVGNQRARSSMVDVSGPASEPPPDTTLPLLDDLHRCELAPGMRAVGETLASLDLRTRTGAAVLAIQRPGRDVVVPTGSEPLRVEDVLILAGSAEALTSARELLVGDSAAIQSSRPPG